ncbi:methyltransferase domain protein [Toxoplasma gondii FOU]|nr:methyltransferase domain protein [Toxoplasma gondii FOU]PUA84364.1 methyltransferase domain protein [Toxoplasma gondii TgCATBr9]
MALATPTAGGPGASTDLTGSSAAPSACPSSCDDFVFPLASLSEAQQWEEEQMHDESTNLISPFCPASEAQIHAALAFGNVTPSDVVLDLGCGDGRVCRTAVRLFSVSRALGVDINPFLVKEAEALTREEFPSCCSSLESSRFHFFELGIPADEDDEDSEQGEDGGGIPRKSGTAGGESAKRDAGGRNAEPPVNCVENVCTENLQGACTRKYSPGTQGSLASSSPSSAPSVDSEWERVPPQHRPFFELVRQYRISVVFIYLVPRQTSRMSKFFRFLLRMRGVRIISLRFALPEGTRQAKNKTVAERCFVPHGDEAEPLFKVYLYSGIHEGSG